MTILNYGDLQINGTTVAYEGPVKIVTQVRNLIVNFTPTFE